MHQFACFSCRFQAAKLADERIADGKARPFEGIPVSIKDNYIQRGGVATAGIAHFAMEVLPEDGLLVHQLREVMGCIPFVRTNVPQVLMLFESSNNIWGSTVNPFDLSRSS